METAVQGGSVEASFVGDHLVRDVSQRLRADEFDGRLDQAFSSDSLGDFRSSLGLCGRSHERQPNSWIFWVIRRKNIPNNKNTMLQL
jgi:hypothetical protein